MISQIHDVKEFITKHTFRQTAQPKHDLSFEQTTCFVSCREISRSTQNNFFCNSRKNKPSRAQEDNFGT